MAKSATLSIDITADSSDAVAAFDKASGSVKSYGDSASMAAKQSRDVSGSIENTGDASANVTTGLRDLGGAMQSMGGSVGAMGTAMVGASTAFEAMDGAATLYKGAQQLATMAAGGFSKAMQFMKVTILTNPIFIIAAIIIGISLSLVIAYKKSETFRKIVDGAFRAVWNIVQAVWGWIKKNWPLLLAVLTGPIGLAVLVISKNWDTIKGGVQTVVDFIGRVWGVIEDTLAAPFEAAWGLISGVFDKIKSAVNNVLDLIGKIKIPKLPDLNPFSASASAAGFVAAPRVLGTARAPAARAPASAAPTIVINGALDPEAVARQVKRLLSKHSIRVGSAATVV